MMRDDNNHSTPSLQRSQSMPAPSLIHVAPDDAATHDTLLALQVTPAQQAYVGNITDLLADVAVCPEADSMVVWHDATPIGYYRIDPHSRSVAGRDFEVPALGLRAFFIDARWQGHGFGAQALAALLDDVAQRHPSSRLLVLTVHTINTAALKLYRRAGFTDDGELYHGGRAGPQHLLRRALP